MIINKNKYDIRFLKIISLIFNIFILMLNKLLNYMMIILIPFSIRIIYHIILVKVGLIKKILVNKSYIKILIYILIFLKINIYILISILTLFENTYIFNIFFIILFMIIMIYYISNKLHMINRFI